MLWWRRGELRRRRRVRRSSRVVVVLFRKTEKRISLFVLSLETMGTTTSRTVSVSNVSVSDGCVGGRGDHENCVCGLACCGGALFGGCS